MQYSCSAGSAAAAIILGIKARKASEDVSLLSAGSRPSERSALARSTKLAVLENSPDQYFRTTKSIPATLSAGSQLHLTRDFVLRKSNELVSIRAQLNLTGKLTDALPDLFWDIPHELGLGSYYDMVGKAPDVRERIKTLNERTDYASEIAAVPREMLSEKHLTRLEWLIVALVAIDVLFGVFYLWQKRSERLDPDSTKAVMH